MPKVKAELEALQGLSGGEPEVADDAAGVVADTASGEPGADTASGEPPGNAPPKNKAEPKTRRKRDLEAAEMPEERIEILDPELEKRGLRISFEESSRIGRRPAGPVRIVLARALYRVPAEEVNTEPKMVTAPLPPELFRRSMLAPSLVAHILVSKYAFGLPFNRLCEMLGHQGIHLDRSTLCRVAENAGATFGPVVDAMAAEARATAFCLSTDATGCAIQPERVDGKGRQACRKGHFFVVLADQDHVFFEYQAKQTSDVVCEMFRGFSGYIQADASAIYDALFRGKSEPLFDDQTTSKAPPIEVGCWAHARRRFWEAATAAKDRRALEGILRIHMFYEAEERWASLPPSRRKELRDLHTRPLIDDFFVWAKAVFAEVKALRSFVSSAFGYVVRQEKALRTFLDDGRLRLDNNHSERGLRPIAVGRKAWLFFGSDDHAVAAANLFSLIASCKLHGIEPERYFAELIRVMPVWPRERYLELAPKYWKATRARLPENALVPEYGFTAVPPLVAAQQ